MHRRHLLVFFAIVATAPGAALGLVVDLDDQPLAGTRLAHGWRRLRRVFIGPGGYAL